MSAWPRNHGQVPTSAATHHNTLRQAEQSAAGGAIAAGTPLRGPLQARPAEQPHHGLALAAAQAACWDGSAAVWRLDPGAPASAAPAALELLVRFRADAAPLRAALWVPREAALDMGTAMDPGRHLVLTAGHAGSLKFWDVGEFEPMLEVPGTMSWIMCAAWLAQPLGVVSGLDHGVLRFFAIALPDKHAKSAVNTIQCAACALFADASASCLACRWGSVLDLLGPACWLRACWL